MVIKIKKKNKDRKPLQYTVKCGCDVGKWTEYFVSLQTSIVLTEDNNVKIKSEGLIGTTEYPTA